MYMLVHYIYNIMYIDLHYTYICRSGYHIIDFYKDDIVDDVARIAPVYITCVECGFFNGLF